MTKQSHFTTPRMMRDGQFSGESLPGSVSGWVRVTCLFAGFVIGFVLGASV